MSKHVPEDLLSSFVEGDVSEQLAIHIAEHLDVCPACNAHATMLEPLASAFAAVEDPLPPEDLAAAALLEASQPARVVRTELWVGPALLAAAAAIVLVAGDPLALAVKVGVLAEAVSAVGGALGATLSATPIALLVSAVAALVGCMLAARLALSGRPALERRRGRR